MKRSQKWRMRAEVYRSIYVELDSHLANGSGFLVHDDSDEPVSDEVFSIRKRALQSVMGFARRQGERARRQAKIYEARDKP